MPGPRNRRKPKAKATTHASVNDGQAPSTRAKSSPVPCLTLDDDEMARCGQPATEGHPKPERCKVHHGQYRILYTKYKEAQQVVDEVKQGAKLPTQEQIHRYTDWHVALEKARWVRKYLEAIRSEKRGREIHQKRFFLKVNLDVDDGHKLRLKLLEREMIKAVDVLDALQKRAYELHQSGTMQATENRASSAAEADLERDFKLTTEQLLDSSYDPNIFRDSTLRFSRRKVLPVLTAPEVGDEDLIDMSLRREKEKMIAVVKHLWDLELFTELVPIPVNEAVGPERDFYISRTKKAFFVMQQFARRIIFHEPSLYMNSLDSVSFKDLILGDKFFMEDLRKFVDIFIRPLEFPLKWFKDAILDGLAISRNVTAANVGKLENRIRIVGGWVFNRTHTRNMPNEGWSLLIGILRPPANVEGRLVRLCNNFDDILGFLAFEAFGYIQSPKFCVAPDCPDFEEPALSRNHLSLAGVIVTDIVATNVFIHGPVPTRFKARKRGCIVWAEAESRTYLFGAVRHEQDGFVTAFLQELRARPDLFQVVLRSETAPGRQVEMFGSGPANDEALPVVCMREFEAPPSPSPPSVPPSANDKLTVLWSARDVLYGKSDDRKGYLNLERNPKGWFFRFKTFPVTYIVIIDTVPGRPKWVLTRNVAWAALRAGGYAQGEYTLRKYAAASDRLFEERMQERLGAFVPGEGFQMMSLEDQVVARGL